MACFTTAVVFFLLAQCATTFARGIHVSILSNPNTAATFARSFVSNIAGCGEFGSQGTEDFDDIMQSLIQAQRMGKGRHDTNAKAKAMQMALASSIAELIVEESGGVNMQQKTNAAINALRNALRSTSGQVDESFVNEIVELVNLFSQDQFNEVDTGSSRQYYQSSTGGGQGGAPTVTETVTVSVGGGGAPQPSGIFSILFTIKSLSVLPLWVLKFSIWLV
ncbi:hypothetical protein AVEN_63557-1 [Araneus ventricosus]|uniref:Spidroin N-terminal domain-containing protein n=1 Tax=Araneus ventricosus TaxID=182803 RepID=A0A4Y2RUY4_ARAVE|nr:hypothetical protein AVEN_63557-1 [Araneus ventricosus]